MNGIKPKRKLDRRQILLICFLIIPTVGIAFVMTFFDIWPVNKFIELQTKWFDGYYYPKLTVLITWMCILLPVVMVYAILKRMVDGVKYGKNSEEGADGSTLISIQRKKHLFNYINAIDIYLDGKKIGGVSSGSTKQFAIHPGNRILHAKIAGFESDPISFSISPGRTIQFETSFSHSAFSATISPPKNSLYIKLI